MESVKKFLALCSLLSVVSASPADDIPYESVSKRLDINRLECRPGALVPTQPNSLQDPRVVALGTLLAVCESRQGLGYVCRNGQMLMGWPPTEMWVGPPDSEYLRTACLQNCRCISDGIGGPSIRVLQAGAGGDAVSSGGSNQGVGGGGSISSDVSDASSIEEQIYECSEFYGHPESSDCERAIDLLDALPEPELYREFIRPGGQRDPSWQFSRRPYTDVPVQTPKFFTHGTCTVAVALVQHPGVRATEWDNWRRILQIAGRTATLCVHQRGVGGTGPLGYDFWDNQLPDPNMLVFVFSPTSRCKRWLDMETTCVAPGVGNTHCGPNIESRPTKKHKGDPGQSSSKPPPAAHTRHQCGGSCISPTDCSASENCLCASDKGIPLSSTWGTFTCTFVANAVAAVAAATRQGTNCRGRCLLSANGTLAIGEGITGPNPRPGLGDLVCPCNCTYASEACCLSTTKLVFEDEGLKAKTTLQPPNSTMCCDTGTGKFRVDDVNKSRGSRTDVACSAP